MCCMNLKGKKQRAERFYGRNEYYILYFFFRRYKTQIKTSNKMRAQTPIWFVIIYLTLRMGKTIGAIYISFLKRA